MESAFKRRHDRIYAFYSHSLSLKPVMWSLQTRLVRYTQDPGKSPKMPDPEMANSCDFYPHENWQFLSFFRLNPRRRPIFIRMMDQASKKSIFSPLLRRPPFWGTKYIHTTYLCTIVVLDVSTLLAPFAYPFFEIEGMSISWVFKIWLVHYETWR